MYKAKKSVCGRFLRELFSIRNALADNPLLHSCNHKARNISLSYPEQFPYPLVHEEVIADHAATVEAKGTVARH